MTAALIASMTDPIVRKSQTNEAGNPGEFGTHNRPEGDTDLGEFVRAAGAAREKATRELELGSAAAAARLIVKLNPDAVSFAPVVDGGSDGTHITGMDLFDKDGESIDEIYEGDDTDGPRWQVIDYARCMGDGSDNSWWAVKFGNGDPFTDKALVSKAAAWSPADEG